MNNKTIKCCNSCRLNGCACTNQFVSDMNDSSLWDIHTDYCSKFEEVKKESPLELYMAKKCITKLLHSDYIEKDKIRKIIENEKGYCKEGIITSIEELIK